MRRALMAVAVAAGLLAGSCAAPSEDLPAPAGAPHLPDPARDLGRRFAGPDLTADPDRAERLLAKTGEFSFGREFNQVKALKAIVAQPDGLERLRRVAATAQPAGRLYALCGLLALEAPEADELHRALQRDRSTVLVFDADLHHERAVSWAARRIVDGNYWREFKPAPPENEWTVADRNTVRLDPSAFPGLPGIIREDLEARGCTIPQTHTARALENAASGRFTSAGERDWAVLCSRDRISAILVYRGGRPSDVVELASAPDVEALQQTGDGIAYSRLITAADPWRIRRYNNPLERPGLPALDHDGIDDSFLEKGSSIHYWSSGRWLVLAGSD